MELLRRGYAVTVGKAGDREIDFVCEKRGQKLYVQVTYLPASPDEFDMSRDGIKHRNIREFLLMPEWN